MSSSHRLRTARRLLLIALPLVVACWTQVAGAWHDEGHVYAATAAVEALPSEAGEEGAEPVPAFFRESAATIAHLSLDPDVWRNRGTPQLDKGQDAEHFFDLELLGDDPIAALPPTRPEFIALCHERGLDPHEVGYLPYAVAEWTGRLTLAFAEHRANPDSEAVRMKCLVYAGILAHYAADLHQPLHTTVHYDGRVEQNEDGTWGESPRTGIHMKVDALPTFTSYDQNFEVLFLLADKIAPRAELMPYILDQLRQSHAEVDTIYGRDGELPDLFAFDDTDFDATPPPILTDNPDQAFDGIVLQFTTFRMHASATFTASLYLTAWQDSASVRLPDWLDRDAFGRPENAPEGFDRTRPIPQPDRHATTQPAATQPAE